VRPVAVETAYSVTIEPQASLSEAADDGTEGAAQAIVIHGLDGRIRQVNAAAARLLGYDAERLCRLTVASLEIEDDLSIVQQRIDRVVQTGHGHFLLHWLGTDGSTLNLVANATLLAKQPAGVQLFLSLAPSHTTPVSISATSHVPAAHPSPFSNEEPKAEQAELEDRRPEEPPNLRWQVRPDVQPQAPLAAQLQPQPELQAELQPDLPPTEGRFFRTLLAAAPQDVVAAAIPSVPEPVEASDSAPPEPEPPDLERRDDERAGWEWTERYLPELLDSLRDAVLIVDPETYRLRDANYAVEALTGYSRAELAHLTAADLLVSEERHGLAGLITTAVERGEASEPYRSTWYAKNGRRIAMEFVANLALLPDGLAVIATGRRQPEPLAAEPVRRDRAVAQPPEVWQHTAASAGSTELQQPREHNELNRTAATFFRSADSVEAQRPPELIDRMPQIVWAAQPNGWIDYYNDRWTAYTGMTVNETQEQGWDPVLHPDDLQGCLDGWVEAVRRGAPYEAQYRFKRAADGAYRWHLARAVPLFDRDGAIVRWFGTCTDIDDCRVVVEECGDFFTHTFDLLSVAGFDGYFKRVNAAYAGVLDRDIGELYAQPIAALLHEDDRATFAAALARLAAGELVVNLRCRMQHHDGSYLWLEWSVVPAAAEGAAYAVARDITARVSTETELRESEEFYRQIVAAAEEGIWNVDADGKTTFVNGKMAQLLGYVARELDGAPLFAFMDEEARAIAATGMDRPRGSSAESCELKLSRRDGSELRTTTTINPLYDSTGSYGGALLMVTESRQSAQAGTIGLRDPRTGMPSRALFDDRLQHAVHTAQRLKSSFAVLAVDLGNPGELVLQAVCERLQDVVRLTDTPCRLDGEQIGVLLPYTDAAGARSVAQKVATALKETLLVDGYPFEASACMGIALYPHHGVSGETVLQRALAAAQAAKRTGASYLVASLDGGDK